jgi:ubiquinone/menaquinone biosynthesis C-methylase UbiE
MTPERYIPGYGHGILTFMAQRTAGTHAEFFLPYLEAGWRVLDAGCGPGTITLGLGARVVPGRVIGIDVEDSQFAAARERAEREGANVEFRRASIYELPFDDGCFDAVFSHGLFQHLSDPLAALVELHRVLRPGGPIGIRAGDMGGTLIDAESSGPARALASYLTEKAHGGGDPYVGRKLGRLLSKAGFGDVHVTASYDVLTEALRAIDPSRWKDFAPAAEGFSLPDAKTDETPFVALAWCEGVAWRR